MISHPCRICLKSVASNHRAIMCDVCGFWVHIKCNGLNATDYEMLQNSNDNWFCLKCINDSLAFNDKSTPLVFNYALSSTEKRKFLSNLNTLNNSPSENDNTNCKYYDSVEFVSQNFNSSYFSLFHLNISSLSKHFNDLTYLLSDLNFNFSAIGITETGFQSKSPSLNCNLNGYTFIHTPSESIKGGALLYISDKLSCSSRPDLDQLCYISHQLESVFVEVIHPKGKNYIIGCIYKHPHMDLHDFNMNHLTPILSKTTSENKNIFLMGDFNANLLLSDSNPDIYDFLDSIFSFSLAPSILLPTRITENTSTLIDNIFHDPFELNCKSGNIISSISDHFPQFLIINKQHVLPPPPTKRSPIPDWNKFNQELFSQKISAIDWNELLCLNELDPSKSFDIFHTFVNNCINECVPLKKSFTRNNTNSHKEWITTGILTSIRKRDALHKQFIKEKDPFIKSLLHTSFKKYRNKLVTLCRISKSNFYKQFFIKNKNNSKAIWDGVRSIISLRSAKSPTPSCLNINNNLTTDALTISNSFNSYFSSIADKLRKSIPPSFKHFSSYLKNPTANSIFFRPTNDLEVLDCISLFDKKKSTGPFSIPYQVLLPTKKLFAVPIAKLINLSFSTGIYPSSLKIAKVIPVYKKGSNVELCNYRPISLLSNIDKIFEKLIFNRLYNFFSMNNTIFPDQFGFRKKFSTSHALLNITQKIMEAIDNGLLVCGVFIDLQKAFDTVDHEILIKKLYHYGIRGVPLSLLRSFLTNREQFVFINNSSSSHKPIRHGVPQGSVLGPLLFLLYINDLHTAIKHSMVHLFADDTNLLNIITLLTHIKSNYNFILFHPVQIPFFCLKEDAISRGQKHLLPKKCTETFVDKAQPEVIEKCELRKKGEKTAKALSSQAISMYAKVLGRVVQFDSAEALSKDTEEDPIIKDFMADLGLLVYSAFGKFLAPLLVAAHTMNHCQLSTSKSV
ncbi:uncharacterized protein LOC130624132 [Hydractinia symbiolongicarpus]|uniref:uncharacterized protein LOC130624132 n=1 Tax=Hydractinia symbiolongicarpus TaxID=13093 RepID=UPI0025506AAC|nr:uncharacterized protein LOC130624132 [Hydractinia symbiolongicarpus]